MNSLNPSNAEDKQKLYDQLIEYNQTLCSICKQITMIDGVVQIWMNANVVHMACPQCLSSHDLHVIKNDEGTFVAASPKRAIEL